MKGCGTTGEGRNRKGYWQVINESGGQFEPHFKCSLKRRGWTDPQPTVLPPGRQQGGRDQ